MAIIISADELKEIIPGYDPRQSHLVHTESAKMADALYAKTIREIASSLMSIFIGHTHNPGELYLRLLALI